MGPSAFAWRSEQLNRTLFGSSCKKARGLCSSGSPPASWLRWCVPESSRRSRRPNGRAPFRMNGQRQIFKLHVFRGHVRCAHSGVCFRRLPVRVRRHAFRGAYRAASTVMSSDCLAPAVNARTSSSRRVTISAAVAPEPVASAASSRSSP